MIRLWLARILAWAVLALSVLVAPSIAAPRIGVNHNLFRSDPVDDAATFKVLRDTGLTQLRIGIPLTYDTEATAVPRLRQIVKLAKANDIRLLVMLQTGFAWGDRTDRGRYPAGDSAALYWQAFNRTLPFVTEFRNDGIDWELGNELNLLVKGANGKPLYGKGWTSAEFNTPLMRDWSQILRGQSDAIESVNRAYNVANRRVLNTTSTNFGFLDFMIGKGVKFEAIDYHYYEKATTKPTLMWGGDRVNYDLTAKLRSFGKAIIYGEVNAAEIYTDPYRDSDGAVSLRAALTQLAATKPEAIIIYELLDEPAKAVPENRFGLMYDLTRPKPAMAVVAEVAR